MGGSGWGTPLWSGACCTLPCSSSPILRGTDEEVRFGRLPNPSHVTRGWWDGDLGGALLKQDNRESLTKKTDDFGRSVALTRGDRESV